jgi:hypothetical protein
MKISDKTNKKTETTMRRYVSIFWVAIVMIFSASSLFAENINIENELQQKQETKVLTNVKTDATATTGPVSVVVDNQRPLPGAPSLVMPGNGTGGVITINNHLITQSRLSDELTAFPSLSVVQVKTAITFMDRTEGADSWGSVNNRIKVYPVITNPRQALPEGEPVYFLDPARVQFPKGFVIGRIIYNDKDKKNPVLLNQFLMRVALDAASVGANAVVFTEQFHQSSVVTKADGISVGGFFSKILGCFSGGSVGGSGGLSSGSVTEFGVAGIAVTFLYIPPQSCQSPVKERCESRSKQKISFSRLMVLIKQTMAACVDCTLPCHGNFQKRHQLVQYYIEWFRQTKDTSLLVRDGGGRKATKGLSPELDSVYNEFKLMWIDFKKGRESSGKLTSDMPLARAEMTAALREVVAAVYQVGGEQAAIDFAAEYGYEGEIPRGITTY